MIYNTPTMTAIQKLSSNNVDFSFNGKSIEVYGTKEEPLFLATDIGQLLDIAKIRNRLSAKNKDGQYIFPQEFKVARHAGTLGGTQNCDFVTEEGVYFLAFRSDKPFAVEFSKKVTSILKSLRLNGYIDTRPNVPRMRPSIQLVNTRLLITESELESAVVKFLQAFEKEYHLLFNPTLGELVTVHSKDRGYHKGTFDIELKNRAIKYPFGFGRNRSPKEYNGLALELKAPAGRNQATAEQIEMEPRYREQGWKTIISNNYETITSKLHRYIMNVLVPCQLCEMKMKKQSLDEFHIPYYHRTKPKLLLKISN